MIGGNKSAESFEEESADASTSGVDIVLQNRLAWVDMDKKKYQKYIKAYVAKLVEKLTETKPDYVATFKKKAIPAVKRILDNFEEWDFYRGETDFEGANGMLCILGYREDQTTPYLLFFKDGLLEEKVVGFLFAWYERSTLKDFSRYYANDILSLNLEKIWKIVISTAFWDSKRGTYPSLRTWSWPQLYWVLVKKPSKANQIAQAHSAGAICSPWKINECWFIPNGTKKIMWFTGN